MIQSVDKNMKNKMNILDSCFKNDQRKFIHLFLQNSEIQGRLGQTENIYFKSGYIQIEEH